jgi:ATP-dependent RNA helicase DeaD
MVRLMLNIGKKHGIRPNDIVGAIAAHASIPGSVIGKIHIQQQRSSVDVPEEFAARVLSKAGETRIRRLPVDMERA